MARRICGLAIGVILTVCCTGDGESNRDAAGSGGGGKPGSGGFGATGGGGVGGAGGGYGGGIHIDCEPPATMCRNTTVEPIAPCCEAPAPPTQENACIGDESLINPDSCSSTGTTTAYRLTFLNVASDCNVGFDLDACNGVAACNPQPRASEGVHGVDNVLATIDGHGAINQLFADAICGRTGAEDASCKATIPTLDIYLAMEMNPEERCASVRISASQAEIGGEILNLGDPTSTGTRCASGSLGAIPLTLGGVEIVPQGWAVRMAVSEAGFSDGLLGATLNAEDAVELAEAAIPDLGANVAEYFDLPHDLYPVWCDCDALSATFELGGVAIAPELSSAP